MKEYLMLYFLNKLKSDRVNCSLMPVYASFNSNRDVEKIEIHQSQHHPVGLKSLSKIMIM
jgi:hypothetical protein